MAALLAVLLTGCIRTAPELIPAVTLAPTPSPTAEPTPSPTPSPTPAPTLMMYDALGEFVSGAEHFKQYIEFKNIQVYEQNGDTFADLIAVNSYSENLVLALDIAFFEGKDEAREEVARGRVQTRDAQYILVLLPGENTLYAQIDTDMTLTSLDFELIFDDQLGVLPE